MQSFHTKFLSRFKQCILEKDLFRQSNKILLAVSGGVDSVVMAHLFHKAGFKFAIAHCNFQLRGTESDGDEAFVKEMASNLEAPFFTIKFDTATYAETHKLSVQMAARELRYTWFDKILNKQGYDYLATAHHKDDLAETVLLNLVKGSVLTGLHGILPKNNKIIRPLLCFEKAEIEAYASHDKIRYREDKSNAESKYQRNMIRNEIIPLLHKINPDLADTIYKNSDRRHQLETWLNGQSEKIRLTLCKTNGEGIEIPVKGLLENDIPAEVFFAWVSGYGFNDVQVEELFADLTSTESRVFYSSLKTMDGLVENYKMTKTRDRVLISKAEAPDLTEIRVYKENTEVFFGPSEFRIETIHPGKIENLKDPSIAHFDLDKLEFPLIIRRWKNGDIFKPYGLKGRKKLSDFLTDLKLDALEKENQLVICSGDKICAVVGRRMDERFKVSARTSRVLKVELQRAY